MRRCIFFCWLIAVSVFSVELKDSVQDLLYRYPTPYQDILINNQVMIKGHQNCDERYALIKPILDLYKKPFTVLDIGAAQGYFSLKIAEEYAAVCVMIEGGYYKEHPAQLDLICKLNGHLNNLIFLKHYLSLENLRELNDREHFDVVLAFLVVHQIAYGQKDYLEKAKAIFKEIIKLGDNVIIETHDDFLFDFLSQKLKGQYLGEVFRRKDTKKIKGHLFWFKKELKRDFSDVINSTEEDRLKNYLGIKLETFKLFNGLYPNQEKIIIQGNNVIVNHPSLKEGVFLPQR